MLVANIKISTRYVVLMPNASLIAATRLVLSRALAVCIQGTNDEGFLDVFLTLVAFPTFRLNLFLLELRFTPN